MGPYNLSNNSGEGARHDRLQVWLRISGITGAAVGLTFVALSHFARTRLELNTRLPGLVMFAAGLIAYSIYSHRAKHTFGTVAAVTLSILSLWMLHEQLARPATVAEWRAADTIGMLLALGALGLGAYHEQQQRLTLAELVNVQRALSTKYLGKFPRFITNIVQELGRADESILIFCDFPAYGIFSDQRAGLEYRQVLERKAIDGVKIELTCLDAETRKRYAREQFTEGTWARWQSDPHAKDRIERFLEGRGSEHGLGVTLDTFMTALHETDEIFLRDVFARKAHEVRSEIPMYFWIVDGRVAIFAISALSDREGWEEYGFMTSDHALIQAFQEMRSRYHRLFDVPGSERRTTLG